MKKIILFSVWTLLLSCAFVSCQKEGPAGPQGDKGEKGDKGPQGSPGNMSIAVQDVTITDWKASGFVDGSFTGKANKLDKIITKNVIAAGAVLVYQVRKDKDILKALPYSQIMERGNPFAEEGAADYTLTATYDVAPGELFVYLQYSTSKMKTVGGKTFRLITIPGALSMRVSARSGSSYSIDQLRSMSYEQVCTALNIQP